MGTARNISLHTPQWCYRAAGFEIEGEPESTAFGPPGESSLAATFTKDNPTGRAKLRVHWSFCGDEKWQAHRYPRTSLAGRTYVYKLYLIRALKEGEDSRSSDDVAAQFGSALRPQLKRVLFAAE